MKNNIDTNLISENSLLEILLKAAKGKTSEELEARIREIGGGPVDPYTRLVRSAMIDTLVWNEGESVEKLLKEIGF